VIRITPGGLALPACAARRAGGLVRRDQLKVEGETVTYESSEHGRRHFCGRCGMALFYTNEIVFPGTIDVQICTLDDPEAVPPAAQIQAAERIGWMERAHELPAFERYPRQEALRSKVIRALP
jgi:hypothetical protein